ncbi:hypothetical protein CEXT_355971 [Caerostris extrusa]|uniref:Uncharacterized protein n=1 Tax=Caerostris extrusa TaxID=172846 RepID=A0AAV4R1L4_CAEEX|nr:hypothetical protein CEXT_355971 [Caerostris extrusa]
MHRLLEICLLAGLNENNELKHEGDIALKMEVKILKVLHFLDRKEQPIRGHRSHQLSTLGAIQAACNSPSDADNFFYGQSRSRGHFRRFTALAYYPKFTPMQINKELVTIAHNNIMGFLNLLTTSPRQTVVLILRDLQRVGRPVYAILPPPENIFRDPITNYFEFPVLSGFMGARHPTNGN